MNNKKKVALVAHDNMKRDLAEWVDWNWEVLLKHHLICTGTTGKMVEKTLRDRRGREFREDDVDITLLKSGPLGGDQQLGALIAEGQVEALTRCRRSRTTWTSKRFYGSPRCITCPRLSTVRRPTF